LQAGDQYVGFPAALGKLFNLCVLGADLAAQKFHLAFEPDDVAVVGGANGRVRSRLFVGVRGCSWCLFALIFQGTNVRVRSRLVAAVRTSFM
jgi:hypothetical protein